MLSILRLLHRNNVSTLLAQILGKQNFTIRDANQVKETSQLTAQNRILIDLQHAEYMLLQFNL